MTSFILGGLLLVKHGLVLAAGGDTAMVYACVRNGTGLVRIVDPNTACHSSEHPLQWNITGPMGPAGPPGPAGGSEYPPNEWDDMTAAAAMGYCSAKHPYASLGGGAYTSDGYERVPSPGVIGAVRRNYIYERTTTAVDESGGGSFPCEEACSEFGKAYEPAYHGHALHQQVGDPAAPTIIASGIGDLAVGARIDWDFYLSRDVVAGMVSRAQGWMESDVAQADFCCCATY